METLYKGIFDCKRLKRTVFSELVSMENKNLKRGYFFCIPWKREYKAKVSCTVETDSLENLCEKKIEVWDLNICKYIIKERHY